MPGWSGNGRAGRPARGITRHVHPGGLPVFSRYSVLAARPRHTLGALAVVLAAVGVAVGSGANFTAHVASAAQHVLSTGTLQHRRSGGSAILNVTNLKPGDVKTGYVDIQNTGSVVRHFSLGVLEPRPARTRCSAQLDLDVIGLRHVRAVRIPPCDPGNSPVDQRQGRPGCRTATTSASGRRVRRTATSSSSRSRTGPRQWTTRCQGKSARSSSTGTPPPNRLSDGRARPSRSRPPTPFPLMGAPAPPIPVTIPTPLACESRCRRRSRGRRRSLRWSWAPSCSSRRSSGWSATSSPAGR